MKVRAGSVGVVLYLVFKEDGIPVPLTGYTAIWREEGVADKTMTAHDAANGIFKWTQAAADFPAGLHVCQVRLTSGTTVIYSHTFTVESVGQFKD